MLVNIVGSINLSIALGMFQLVYGVYDTDQLKKY